MAIDTQFELQRSLEGISLVAGLASDISMLAQKGKTRARVVKLSARRHLLPVDGPVTALARAAERAGMRILMAVTAILERYKVVELDRTARQAVFGFVAG